MQINRVLLVVLLVFMSCKTDKAIDIQGHRGCRGLLPENSLPAFKKAIELGVHTLEFDIAITKDQKVIVSHEPFMSRTICKLPNGGVIPESEDMRHNLYQMTFDSIKHYDCGTAVHPRFPDQQLITVHKPLMGEVFELSEKLNPDIKYNIELKAKPEYDNIYTPTPDVFVTLVLDEIKRYGVEERVNLQSFDLRILEAIRAQNQYIAIALLVDENESIEGKLNKLSYTPEIISPYYKLLDNTNTEEYQKNGYKVIPWTINSLEDMKLMISYGVDGIITDYPNRLLELLR